MVRLDPRPLAPIRVHVADAPGLARPPDLAGASPLLAALAVHLQRIACGGAQMAALLAPVSRDFMEGETGQTGWRAQIQPDSLHLIQTLEESGLLEFGDD